MRFDIKTIGTLLTFLAALAAAYNGNSAAKSSEDAAKASHNEVAQAVLDGYLLCDTRTKERVEAGKDPVAPVPRVLKELATDAKGSERLEALQKLVE